MQYLESFTLPDEDAEAGYVLSYPAKLEMSCYSATNTIYPFRLFPEKGLRSIECAPVTLFYGGNGSGKSTLLNIIAAKLELSHRSPVNETPLFEDYLPLCRYRLSYGKKLPAKSRIITSDDVFDSLLEQRSINEHVNRQREELFAEYDSYTDPNAPCFRMHSLSDYDELKARNEARSRSKNQYTEKRLAKNLRLASNGETAFRYFTQEISSDALYLLDEPENSLSAALQKELAAFLSDSARFYGCQFLICTHSPFLLSLREAVIYDLDAAPVERKKWTELENIRTWYDLFRERKNEFEP